MKDLSMVSTAIPPAALPPDEAARYMGLPRSTFDRIAKSDNGLTGIRIGGRRVYRVEMLDAYLRSRELQESQSDE